MKINEPTRNHVMSRAVNWTEVFGTRNRLNKRPLLKLKNILQKGFSLTELLIVVAIIGIIAGVGYPSYLSQAEKTRRTEGKAALTEAAQKQQQFFQERRRYTANVMELYGKTGATMETLKGLYTVSSELTGGGVGFTLTATPVSDGLQDGDFTLTLNHLGQTTPSEAW